MVQSEIHMRITSSKLNQIEKSQRCWVSTRVGEVPSHHDDPSWRL